LHNLLDRAPVWIVVPEQLLQGYLDSTFGRMNLAQINLREIAKFDKPGSRARLAIYEATAAVPSHSILDGSTATRAPLPK
jgi:hypothetical protein